MRQDDPVKFIDTYSVDIKGWFEGLMQQGGGGKDAALVNAANAKGACQFDFGPVGGFLGFGVDTVQARMVWGGGIKAYWVPYHAGMGLPCFADVPRLNPGANCVFTAGMNGCAFVITDSPKGGAYMRVYHNQHPNSQGVWNDIHAVGQAVISYVDYNDYGGGALPLMMNPVAFNFLYYRNAKWMYVFQPQAFHALSQAPAQRLKGQSSTRSAF